MTHFDGEIWICDVQATILAQGGGSQPSQQTITQQTQIPEFEQSFATQNENIATALAAQPFPVYGGPQIQDFSPQQVAGLNAVNSASGAYRPDLQAAEGLTAQGAQTWNPGSASQYMSPYALSALGPQLQQLQQQQAQNSLNIDQRASQAGAFGDARQGVQQGLNNFFGGLTQQDVIGQGLNSAYNSGLSAFQNDQGRLLAAGNQFSNLGGQEQSLGLGGANALFEAGQQQQNLGQSALNASFNNFWNQVQWPQEMLNLRIATLANTPYSSSRITTLPPPNTLAQNLGAFGALAGGVGSLVNKSGASSPFGGSTFPT